MDCHNSDFSGSFGDFWQQPWALSVPGESGKMSFTLAFSQAQEREQLFRRQTKPSLGVADALDVACTRLHCHHSSSKAPTGSHCPVLPWRGRRQWCVCEVWALAAFLSAVHQGSRARSCERPHNHASCSHCLPPAAGWRGVGRAGWVSTFHWDDYMEIVFLFYWLKKLQNHFCFKLNMLP